MLTKNSFSRDGGALPNNEIWYTSSDGNIVTPYQTNSLPTIVSNTYIDGKGVIKFATDVIYIEGDAFSNCGGLASLTIPYSVISIGDHAFYGCTGLNSIEIPNSVASIGNSAFSNCRSLTSVTIPDSVTSIGESAFYLCEGLTSIEISNSVTSIGESAFYGCTGLTKVNITDITAWCNIAFNNLNSNPLINANHLYVNDVEVTDLAIPNSITTIGGYTFSGCAGLTSVTIPNSVTRMSWYAFYNCTGLTSVVIPNSVTYIGWYVFDHCTGLTSATIPDSVTEIGESAFGGCSGLTSISIPDSVTSIAGKAFGLISAKILFSKLYSTYTNKIFDTPTSLGEASYTYNVEFNISEIPTDYNISSMLPQVASDSKKVTLTYNIYTDYAPCKDQALALANTNTIVKVYHIDGTSWE